jgi:hypothetical protein
MRVKTNENGLCSVSTLLYTFQCGLTVMDFSSEYNCKRLLYKLLSAGNTDSRISCHILQVDGVRPRLWTATTNGPTVHPPHDTWVWTATVEWYWQGKPEHLGNKPAPVPFCPPQIPHGLTRARTRASAVRDRRLTAWAMARPSRIWSSSKRV